MKEPVGPDPEIILIELKSALNSDFKRVDGTSLHKLVTGNEQRLAHAIAQAAYKVPGPSSNESSKPYAPSFLKPSTPQ